MVFFVSLFEIVSIGQPSSICYVFFSASFVGGIICFNVRDGELDDYQGKMLELEKEGRWENVSKKTMPLYESDDMPKEVSGYIYRVLRN